MLKKIKIISVLSAFVAILGVSGSVLAQSVTQSYSADSVLQRGMIVGLSKDDPHRVETVNLDQFDRVHGVVIQPSDSAVLLGSEKEQTYVARTGRFVVIVSNQNGDIGAGDYIALSSLSGIGMKAGSKDLVIVGKATESFKASDSAQLIGTATVKSVNGDQQKIGLGRVVVDINVGKNPLLKSDDSLPSVLRRASEYIAGKPVSPVRVYMSIAILVATTLIAGSLIYSSVRSSLIAVGRNPLSKRSIIRGMFQVVIIGLMVFVSGLFGVYLLLKL